MNPQIPFDNSADTLWRFQEYPLMILQIPFDDPVDILWQFRRWTADYLHGESADIVKFLVTCTLMTKHTCKMFKDCKKPPNAIIPHAFIQTYKSTYSCFWLHAHTSYLTHFRNQMIIPSWIHRGIKGSPWTSSCFSKYVFIICFSWLSCPSSLSVKPPTFVRTYFWSAKCTGYA